MGLQVRPYAWLGHWPRECLAINSKPFAPRVVDDFAGIKSECTVITLGQALGCSPAGCSINARSTSEVPKWANNAGTWFFSAQYDCARRCYAIIQMHCCRFGQALGQAPDESPEHVGDFLFERIVGNFSKPFWRQRSEEVPVAMVPPTSTSKRTKTMGTSVMVAMPYLNGMRVFN